jgi:Lon protease-like protein
MAAQSRRAHPDDLGSEARTQEVDSTEAEKIANEMAALLAREHGRAKIEQGRREAAESIAADLAVLLSHDRAELEHEREARLSAEARLRELIAPDGDEDGATPRFVPAARAPRRLHRVP